MTKRKHLKRKVVKPKKKRRRRTFYHRICRNCLNKSPHVRAKIRLPIPYCNWGCCFCSHTPDFIVGDRHVIGFVKTPTKLEIGCDFVGCRGRRPHIHTPKLRRPLKRRKRLNRINGHFIY